jgi:hypothetical protein
MRFALDRRPQFSRFDRLSARGANSAVPLDDRPRVNGLAGGPERSLEAPPYNQLVRVPALGISDEKHLELVSVGPDEKRHVRRRPVGDRVLRWPR